MTADIGHNSDARLKSFVTRIERLESEKKTLSEDIKDVYTELGAAGFDKKITRKVIARRKKDRAAAEEEEALIETYLRALGDLAETPLGKAAMAQARK